MHILVVGGAGYIGSVTVDQLVDAGHDVTVLDSLVAGHKGALNPGSEFVQADVRDEEELNRLFASHNFDAVINYGGYIIAPGAPAPPGGAFATKKRGGGFSFFSFLWLRVGACVFFSRRRGFCWGPTDTRP